MKIKMDPPRDRDRQISGLHQRRDGNNRSSASDDVRSVSSWSEYIGASQSSSSSESGSRPSSVSSRQGSISSLSNTRNSPSRAKSFIQDVLFGAKQHTKSGRRSSKSLSKKRLSSGTEVTVDIVSSSSIDSRGTSIPSSSPSIGVSNGGHVRDGTIIPSSPGHVSGAGQPYSVISYGQGQGTSQNTNHHIIGLRTNSSPEYSDKEMFESCIPKPEADYHHQHQLTNVTPPVQSVYPILDLVANNGIHGDNAMMTNTGGSFLHNDNTPTRRQQSSSRPKFFEPYMSKSSNGRQHSRESHSPCYHIPNTNSSSSYSCSPGDSTNVNCATDSNNAARESNVQHVTRKVEQASLQGSAFRSQPNISRVNNDVSRLPKSSSNLDSMRNNEHRLEPDNVKTKLLSAWNNFKYGWTLKTKSSMKYDTPLYLLGRIYHKRREDDGCENNEEHEFLKHFFSRIWLTYRSNFYPIPGTRLITDCGWGCMLRSGQMLVAQCLITHFLGQDWRLHNPQTQEEQAYHREIIRWFSDPVDEAPSDKSPFCLHHLANFGRLHKKEPGEWYGPASVAFIFRDAFEKASQSLPILNQLCLYVAQDCTVYIDDVLDLCTAPSKSESVGGAFDMDPACDNPQAVAGAGQSSIPRNSPWQRSLIILIPVRLGGEMLNDIYVPCVKKLLSQDNCMGIIGGKPKHSLYFLGYQEDKLIYLDPHYCRDAVETRGNQFKIETYHCMSPRKLQISKMDPSCTAGFYIKDEREFRTFVESVREVASPNQDHASYPMFIFSEGSHRDAHGGDLDSLSMEKGKVKVRHYHLDNKGQRHRAFSKESEDFIML